MTRSRGTRRRPGRRRSLLQIDGVEIADSFAWARLAEDGAPVLESVYWPDIPADVVREAVALKTKLADDAFRTSATVSYDVAEETGKVSHFDGEARRIELAQAQPNAWGDHARMATERPQ